MRISTGQMYQNALKHLLDQQAQLARTQQQISTGKRVMTPADDPAAMASLLGINQSLQVTRQYQDNIAAARMQLSQEENVLGAVNRSLDRVRELALQANGGTLSDADRRSIAIEMRQQLDHLLGLANTLSPGGEYLFAGYQGLTRPFSIDADGVTLYHGDGGQRLLQVGPGRQIAVSDSGRDVFLAAPRGNGSFAALAHGANAGGAMIGTHSVSGAYDGGAYTIGFPVATAAAVPLAFGDAGGNDDLSYTLSINGVEVYSVSASGTPAATLTELADAINAESGATGVRAIVDGGALYLAHTQPPGQGIEVVESMGGASDGEADTVVGYFGSVLDGASGSASLTYPAGAATRYVVEDADGQVVASGPYVEAAPLAFRGVQVQLTGLPQTGDTFSIEPAGHRDLFATVGGLIQALESGQAGAVLGNAVNTFLADIDQAMDRVRGVRSDVGTRLKTLEVQEDLNEDAMLRLDTTRSGLEDLDYAAAITQFSRQVVGLEAAQKSFIQIQGLTLFDYLR